MPVPDARVMPFVDSHDPLVRRAKDAADARPFPPRFGCSVVPLIEAAEMYPALEELVLGANESVYFAFRIFDPTTKARSEQARKRGLEDWTAVLKDAVLRGVTVRLLLTDFEPVMANDLHAGSWTTFHVLQEMAAELPEERRDALEMMIIQQEGEIGWGWRQLLRLPLRLKISRLVRSLDADGGDPLTMIRTRPGLWRHIRDKKGHLRYRPAPPPRLWPATYHQKFAIIDHHIAILGGLDVDERRYDDKRHRQRADQTWHDLSVRLEGPAVADCVEHFRTLWNGEMDRYRAIAAEWMTGAERKLTLDPLDPIPAIDALLAASGSATAQMLRTRSRHDPRLFAVGPRPHIRELKAAHRNMIFSAKRLLYVEAQFFRSLEAAEWICKAATANPHLQVILLIANAPEEVAFAGQEENPAHRHGEYLQSKAIRRMRRVLGDRLGVFSLAKQHRVAGAEKQFSESRGSAFNSGLVYIHAKLLIADDASCLVSSANINGRSFEWDTEFGLLWQDGGEAGIGRFRERLWTQLLGDRGPGTAEPEDALTFWRHVAGKNVARQPEDRQGFVIPYQERRARRYGKRVVYVPDDLV